MKGPRAGRDARGRAFLTFSGVLACLAIALIAVSSSPEAVAQGDQTAAGRALGLQAIDGGLKYYGRFAHGLPTSASYFPIGAWLRPAHDPEHFRDYKNFGMNVFVGVECPECAKEAMI